MHTEINTIFIDMDETICGFKSPKAKNKVEKICPVRSFFAKNRLIFPEEIDSTDPYSFWPEKILKKANVCFDDFWIFLKAHYANSVFIYKDAIKLLEYLKTKDYIKVYPATTNPKLIILAKLAIEGFGDQNKSDFFEALFGGEEVIAGGKSSSVFYKALLEKSNTSATTTMMIGDHEKYDLQFAREAGINKVILPRRNQAEDIIHANNGGIYVNSLEHVIQLL
jgi:FMN phosphatase YigB (HAD superfamily)